MRSTWPGNISMPLIGEVRAANLTTAQLDERLTEKLGEKYLENPDVSVAIKASTGARRDGRRCGEAMPGRFPVGGPMTLMQAVALAKGTSEDANARRVAVFRHDRRQAAGSGVRPDRHPARRSPDPQIYPGDIVVVDGSAVKAAQKQILQSIPLLSIFRPILSRGSEPAKRAGK